MHPRTKRLIKSVSGLGKLECDDGRRLTVEYEVNTYQTVIHDYGEEHEGTIEQRGSITLVSPDHMAPIVGETSLVLEDGSRLDVNTPSILFSGKREKFSV